MRKDDIMICPSMMVADFRNLEKTVQELDEAGSDVFHIDIMDGSFVPNFGMGLQDIEAIRKSTDKLIDVHLMISNPGNYIETFANLGVDIIYIHPESELHPARTLAQIKEKNIKVGIAINPGTSVEAIKPLLHLIDYLMVMTVNPGFAGQDYLDYVDDKIDEIIKVKDDYGFEVLVDGAISSDKIKMLKNKGVKGFVLGTSGLFGKERSYKELISEYRDY